MVRIRKNSGGEQIESLQALRALAFLGVFLQHLGELKLGAWAVSVFFVLSGMLMGYRYNDVQLDCSPLNCVKFAIQKIKKLYPLHIVTMLLCLVYDIKNLIPTFSVAAGAELFGKLVANMLLIQSWFPNSEVFFSFNGLSWYLSSSLFVYACFPCFLMFLKRLSLRKAVLVGLAIYLVQWIAGFTANQLCPKNVFWIVYIFPVFRLGDFFIGCCLGKVLIRLKSKVFNLSASFYSMIEAGIVVIFIVIQCFYSAHYNNSEYIWLLTTLIHIPLAVSMVLIFAIREGCITKILSNQVFIAMGNVSAYTYLIHQVVIRYALSISHRLTGHGLDGVILLFLTIVCAVIYQRLESYIEEIYLDQKRMGE